MPDYVRLLKTNPKITQTLNQVFAERLKNFSCLIEEVSLKDAKQRLAKFLLDMLHEKRGDRGSEKALQVPFTREEIAQRLGTARETVARHLSQLKDYGLIEIKTKQVIIRDEEGLKKLLR
jgi:CRP-like cAMP-binding protein